MLELILQILGNWFAIWTAPSFEALVAIYTAYAAGTMILCMPGYLLSILPMTFGAKGKIFGKILQYTVITNVVLAFAPIAIPCVIGFYGVRSAYRLGSGRPVFQIGQNSRRRQRQRDDDDDD